MAKKKSRKRGWSGAPAPRPPGSTRPGGTRPAAGGTTPAAAAGGTAPTAVDGETAPSSGTTTSPGTATTAAAPGKPAPTGSAATTTQAASNRAARKEEARRQREALRRKEARRKAMRRWGLIAGVVVVAGGVIALLILNNQPKSSNHKDPSSLPGISTAPAPWPPETAELQARIDKMGLPPLGAEALAYHIHQILQVYVHGAPEPVPNGIGALSATQLAEIHTHTGNGTIHVEAGAQRKYTLGDVFD